VGRFRCGAARFGRDGRLSAGMTAPRLDLLAIGNAIVDVIAPADDALIAAAGLVKGSMRLIGADGGAGAARGHGGAAEICGGSAANTAVGWRRWAAARASWGWSGRMAGQPVHRRPARRRRVEAFVPAEEGGAPTARCLILVSADGQRSMCTFPGAAHMLAPAMSSRRRWRTRRSSTSKAICGTRPPPARRWSMPSPSPARRAQGGAHPVRHRLHPALRRAASAR
jgi:sugar/nucleoside kinase (ribokinase family)